MNKDTLEKMANSAFANLTAARDNLFTAAENAMQSKLDLENAKAAAMNSGKIDGKNAESREAQMKEFLNSDFSKLAQAEKAERAARYEFDKAQIEVDTVKTLLRIAELSL